MINAIGIALSGLQAATQRVNVGASNIANVMTAGSLNDPDNPPYTPVTVQSRAQGETGGVIADIVPKANPFSAAYDPDSPLANEDGVVGVPNVDLAEEAVNLKLAEVTYKANIATIRTQNEMFDALLKSFDKKI